MSSGCGSTRPMPTLAMRTAWQSARAASCARGASPMRWPRRAFAAPTRARADSRRAIGSFRARTSPASSSTRATPATSRASSTGFWFAASRATFRTHGPHCATRSAGSRAPAARRCSPTPADTKLGRSGMRRLLAEFRDAGGRPSRCCRRRTRRSRLPRSPAHARVFGLMASCGSDYHGPGESWMDLGGLPDMPAGVGARLERMVSGGRARARVGRAMCSDA